MVMGPAAKPAPMAAPTVAHRVLVVDDNPSVLQYAAAMLSRIGFGVTIASGAPEALSHFTGTDYSLVLADYEMPLLNGYRLACRFKKSRPNIKAVIMTASAMEEIDWLMCCEEIDGWLFKPFSIEDLRRVVTALGLSAK